MLASILLPIAFAYGVAGETRYIVDTVDLLGEQYPFPLELCLQTSVTNSLARTSDVYTTYQCNSEGTQVTKYVWDAATIGDLSAQQQACTDLESAASTVITADGKTQCDTGYFNCNGEANYGSVMMNVYLFAENTDNCATAPFLQLPLVVATGACTCEADLDASARISCDAERIEIANFTGLACAGESTLTLMAVAGECPLWMPLESSGITLYVHVTMENCVVDDSDDSANTTDSPTRRSTTRSGGLDDVCTLSVDEYLQECACDSAAQSVLFRPASPLDEEMNALQDAVYMLSFQVHFLMAMTAVITCMTVLIAYLLYQSSAAKRGYGKVYQMDSDTDVKNSRLKA